MTQSELKSEINPCKNRKFNDAKWKIGINWINLSATQHRKDAKRV